MASLLAIWVGEWVFPGRHLHWLDPVAAIAVALLIVKSAYSVTVESGRGLMDTSLPPEEEEIIREHVMKLYPVVRGFHRLRTRKSGPDRFALFHVLVSGEMSVEESHRLNDRIVNSIREHLPGCTVHIHMEPCGGDCERDCKGCLMGNKEEAETRAKDSADAS
jgi:cation diffusion facilitator family transporter